ncbi:hypothetical protein [Anaplasma capra]|uniref:hypothetical protein n=1 Tax=Anaplasma capra TaxID=1562740 RepID=UPI0021D5D708|nr:hypothetical protein [Anaplasma capra]MCU7611112.1 hypothetical protein [Anaplasma capra]MCU7612384.1 hypothetical protein [Anaplasma capra]
MVLRSCRDIAVLDAGSTAEMAAANGACPVIEDILCVYFIKCGCYNVHFTENMDNCIKVRVYYG